MCGHGDGGAGLALFPISPVALPIVAKRGKKRILGYGDARTGLVTRLESPDAFPGASIGRTGCKGIGRDFYFETGAFRFLEATVAIPTLPVILGTGILGQWGGLGPGAGFAKCNHGKRNKQQDAEEYGVGIYGSGHFIYISNIACACTVGGKYSPLCRIECCQKTCFLEARGFDCGIEIPGTG